MCNAILANKIVNNIQLEAAIEYLEKNKFQTEVNVEEFDKASGVGVEIYYDILI
jgi:hypothetical protein